MDTEILQLNAIHSSTGEQIFALESLTVDKALKDKIKYALYNVADVVTEVIEVLECANTANIPEGNVNNPPNLL